MDGEVAFDLDLASEAPSVFLLLAAEMHRFRGQDVAAAVGHAHTALAAAALAAAGAGQEDVLVGKRGQQGSAALHHFLALAVVYVHGDIAGLDHILLGDKQYRDK